MLCHSPITNSAIIIYMQGYAGLKMKVRVGIYVFIVYNQYVYNFV